MAKIEIKKAPDGRVLARRYDGKPLTEADRGQARVMAQVKENRLRARIIDEIRDQEGEVTALLICSAFLEDHVYVALDPSFRPSDGKAIYYADEIEQMKDRSPEEIKDIHKAKLAFPGARVIQ